MDVLDKYSLKLNYGNCFYFYFSNFNLQNSNVLFIRARNSPKTQKNNFKI